MAENKNICALAGLLADPLMTDQMERIVPAQWLEQVKQAQPLALKAARLAAGSKQEPPKGELGRPLQSVFNNIQTTEGSPPGLVYWPQSPLALTEAIVMPRPQVAPSDQPWVDFLSRAKELQSQYEGAREDALPSFIENLLLLMQRYLWCLTCSYQSDLPDVSLYDQSRMTAALASALAEGPEGDQVALLVGGDLSGVQRFIYTITARGATSSLRGRSFYLQLLTEACVRFLLRKLGLPASSLIYAGGGNFYFLAPTYADLAPLREYISSVLLYHHSGDLYLAVDSLLLREQDFFQGKIANRWQDLANKLNKTKFQPFAESPDRLSDVFTPQGHGGNEDLQCQVCGLEHPDTKLVKRGSDEEGVRICPACASYEDLGKDLRKAGYLSFQQFSETPLPDTKEPVPGGWEEVLAHFGVRASISQNVPKLGDEGNVILLSLDDENANTPRPSTSLVVGRRFLVNVTPVITQKDLDGLRKDQNQSLPDLGDVKPYDVLESQSDGINRLGVMRMDVDNLSKVVSSGFGERATLSRMGALSFAISLFFEGWVGCLAEGQNRKDKLGERLYSIYSGGDDLFFVGSWDAVVELGRQIRADLSRFAGNHPGIHASAGIVLIGGKYPLYQAAQDAGVAEDDAKSHYWYDASGASKNKDAVTFLGQTVEWSRFGTHACTDLSQQTVHAWAHRLEGRSIKDAPHALLGLLIRLQGRYDAEAEKRRKQGTGFEPGTQTADPLGTLELAGVYYLRRMQKRSGPVSQHMLQDILDLFQGDQFASIQWIGLAARWAELKLRNKSS